jgi:hypothetical protein
MECKDLTEKQRDVVIAMQERYKHVAPVIFMRSFSLAKNEVELFDILDTVPTQLPILWSHEAKQWQQFTKSST